MRIAQYGNQSVRCPQSGTESRRGIPVSVSLSLGVGPDASVGSMSYPMTAAAARLGELAAEARDTHRPVTIGEQGRPLVAIIGIEDLADLQDGAALAAHLSDKAADRGGVPLGDLDAALDKIDAQG